MTSSHTSNLETNVPSPKDKQKPITVTTNSRYLPIAQFLKNFGKQLKHLKIKVNPHTCPL